MMRYLWILDVGIRDSNRLRGGWSTHLFPIVLASASLPLCLLFGFDPLIPLVVFSAVFLLCNRRWIVESFSRIKRMGWFAPTRPRWWIELAALDWILFMAGICFWIKLGLGGGAAPWQNIALNVIQRLVGWSFSAFFVLAICGYVTGLLRGRRVAGHSLETVNFFFWIAVLAFATRHAPIPVWWLAPTLLVIAAIALVVATLIVLRRHARLRLAESSTDAGIPERPTVEWLETPTHSIL